ncbi:MAG: leucyl aminopeptidase [Anaerolineae bacterium]|nr:leucyl aminopeptidase [Anaerolineae bacterium]
MEIKAIAGAIQEATADAMIVNLFEGVSEPGGATQAVDAALGGALADLLALGDFSGKIGEVAVLYPRGALPARRVIVVGLGPQAAFGAEAVRHAAAAALRQARDLKAVRVATVLHGAGAGDLAVEAAAEALAEGSALAMYDYRGQKREPAAVAPPDALDVLLFDAADVAAAQRGIDAGLAIAAGVVVTRDLANLPPNYCTPAYMAKVAGEVGEAVGLRVQALERGQMQALGMGALLAVAQGSDAPPRFIIMEHNADRSDELDTIVLIGKGVTFDTGGYSLKSKDGMATMKMDMAGGAAVIGAMRALAALDVPLHVVGLIPASDNMISGGAYRSQEVVTASNGVTIEVVSTDAEGRMLLADALVFAGRYTPAAVVDIATLTGACFTALGGVAAGLFSTDERLQKTLLAAGDGIAEKLWPLPLYEEYERTLESETADVTHGAKPYIGVGASAIFLKHFVDYPAWAHIDMAGLAGVRPGVKYPAYVPAKGATGYGARLLTAFVRGWAAQ